MLIYTVCSGYSLQCARVTAYSLQCLQCEVWRCFSLQCAVVTMCSGQVLKYGEQVFLFAMVTVLNAEWHSVVQYSKYYCSVVLCKVVQKIIL